MSLKEKKQIVKKELTENFERNNQCKYMPYYFLALKEHFLKLILVSELNNLIDKISVICEQIFDDRSKCFFHLKKFRKAVNDDQENNQNDMTDAFDKLNAVLYSIDLNQEQKLEIEQQMEYIKYGLEKLEVSISFSFFNHLIFIL